nr:MAG: hypothetical protein EDM05_16075 [Leptolyngbya sp. IPPAS B-1204]
MNIVFTYGPGTTLEQMVAFETAGRLWSTYFTDDATVNIYVEPSSTLPTGVAGGALMGIEADQSYSTWRTQLAADRKSADDQTVHQNLPSNTNSFTAWVNQIGPDGMTSNKLEQSSNTLNLSRANAKALGMRNPQDGGLDGYILMNDQLTSLGLSWNYDLNGAPPANSVDFFSVAVHEIGHVLGFYSGVDPSGWQLTPIAGFGDDDDDDDDDDGSGTAELDPRGPLKNATSLDMMRFSNEGKLDLVVGGSPFFSINGGITKNADFATGVDRSLGGDGYQASHWKSSGGGLGIMEPDIDLGSRRNVTGLDRRGFDVIGWDPGTASVDLLALQTQAKQFLAQRLGVTVAQLEANPALAQQLTLDRSQDVAFMVEQSQIYEWRRSRRARSSGWWHEFNTANPAAATADTANAPANNLATGWTGIAVTEPDGLINGLNSSGSQPPLPQQGSLETSGVTPLPLNSPLNSDLLSSALTSSNLSDATSLSFGQKGLTAIEALAPNYLIGSELIGSGVLSSAF